MCYESLHDELYYRFRKWLLFLAIKDLHKARGEV